MTTVAGRDETREVVHVAVRIVAGDAAAEPDNFRQRRDSREKVAPVFAAKARIALLHGAEQALFGGEDEPGR